MPDAQFPNASFTATPAAGAPVATPSATPPSPAASSVCQTPEYNRFGIFAECPHCGGSMSPEHAHYRCGSCGWRDSCCD